MWPHKLFKHSDWLHHICAGPCVPVTSMSPLGFCCCQVYLKHPVCGFCVTSSLLDASSCHLEPTVELVNIFGILFNHCHSAPQLFISCISYSPFKFIFSSLQSWVIVGWHLWPFLVFLDRSPVCLDWWSCSFLVLLDWPPFYSGWHSNLFNCCRIPCNVASILDCTSCIPLLTPAVMFEYLQVTHV